MNRLTSPLLPQGFTYLADVLDPVDERALLDQFARLSFNDVRMHGVVAKRRTLHYGWRYGYDAWNIEAGPPIPEFLLPVRTTAAALAGVEPGAFEEALITEYPPGAVIGWHRDAPMFGDLVAGLSLGSTCRMRFRRAVAGAPGRFERLAILLEPRSAYVMRGPARSEWQHSIPTVDALRYSITFRTLRPRRAARRRPSSDAGTQ